jgi:23S rRNA pseudouridine955/2504/2580 synthase
VASGAIRLAPIAPYLRVAGRWPNPVQHVKLTLHKRVDENGENSRKAYPVGRNNRRALRRME